MALAKKANDPRDPMEMTEEEFRKYYPEFRDLLMEREKQILERVDLERAQIDEQVMTSPGDVGDASVSDLSADYYLNLADRDRRELREIRDALDRMRRGVYGICENCELPIGLERLRRMPFARLCIDCQSSVEAGRAVAGLNRTPKL